MPLFTIVKDQVREPRIIRSSDFLSIFILSFILETAVKNPNPSKILQISFNPNFIPFWGINLETIASSLIPVTSTDEFGFLVVSTSPKVSTHKSARKLEARKKGLGRGFL